MAPAAKRAVRAAAAPYLRAMGRGKKQTDGRGREGLTLVGSQTTPSSPPEATALLPIESEEPAFDDSPRGQRVKGVYGKALSDAQRETVAHLYAEGKTPWLEKRNGQSVIAEFRRYVESDDAKKIGEGLYHFLHQKGGFIAHYNLDGFRHEFADPAYLLSELFAEARGWGPGWRRGDQWAYKDGMTSREVGDAILAFAEEQLGMVAERSYVKSRERELALARELTAKYGYSLTDTRE